MRIRHPATRKSGCKLIENPAECSGPPHLLGPWGSAGPGAVTSGLLMTPLPAGHPASYHYTQVEPVAISG
jgi:hypothetical protein